jgi:hypothetical protein
MDNKTKFWFLLCLGPNNYSDTSAYMSEPIKKHAPNPHPPKQRLSQRMKKKYMSIYANYKDIFPS